MPNFSAIAAPLTDVTKGGKPGKIEWNQTCENPFTTLKERLCSNTVCCLPNFDLKFLLQTDASEDGIEAILCQDQG